MENLSENNRNYYWKYFSSVIIDVNGINSIFSCFFYFNVSSQAILYCLRIIMGFLFFQMC